MLKIHTELLEMKSVVCKKKNTLDEIDSRLDITEEKMSEHRALAIETTQNKIQREKKIKKKRLSVN